MTPHDHHGSGDHSTTAVISGPAITLKRVDKTTIRCMASVFRLANALKSCFRVGQLPAPPLTKIDRTGHGHARHTADLGGNGQGFGDSQIRIRSRKEDIETKITGHFI